MEFKSGRELLELCRRTGLPISELMRQTSFSTLQASESDLLFGLALTAAASLDGTASPVGWRLEMHALPERPLR